MDWLPHIVVKAEDDVSIPTSVAALKTFSTGFPDTKATVHCIGAKASDFCVQWCKENGHKLLHYPSTVKTSQLHYEITKRTRLPIVLIAGTTVFYDDMSDYTTTKAYAADTIPAWDLNESVTNIKSIEKTVIYVAQPLKVIAKLEEICKYISSYVATESKNSMRWGSQSVVMCGKVYKQTSGIFNMIYNYESTDDTTSVKLMSNFSSVTADKYETVFGGNSISSMMKKMESIGKDTSKYMPYVNAALNEDWESVKGYRKVWIDSIS